MVATALGPAQNAWPNSVIFFMYSQLGLGVGLMCLRLGPHLAAVTSGWEDGDAFVLQMFAFGLLLIGCSPGGIGSNNWTALLGGDLELSMCMTLASSIAAFGVCLELGVQPKCELVSSQPSITHSNGHLNRYDAALAVHCGPLAAAASERRPI